MADSRKHHIKMLARLIYLGFIRQTDCSFFLRKSYDSISKSYDQVWTSHMRDKTDAMINSLSINTETRCLDLTCGTGYATGKLSEKSKAKVVGVDQSEGMLECARENYADKCEFICSDILEYLKQCPAESFDLITCCWGLGYSHPGKIIKQIKRVLAPGGTVAIIDNSLFSLKEIIYCSYLTFAEQPEKLANLMKFRFLSNSGAAALLIRLNGLKVKAKADGNKSYFVASGREAIDRLCSSGAAAGFEYAAEESVSYAVFGRFAEIIEQKYLKNGKIEIIHRYWQVTAEKR